MVIANLSPLAGGGSGGGSGGGTNSDFELVGYGPANERIYVSRPVDTTTGLLGAATLFAITTAGATISPYVGTIVDPTRRLITKTVRLGGTLLAAAVPEIPAHVTSAGVSVSQIDMVPGKTFALPGDYDSLDWNWMRATAPDPGDGSISEITINSAGYRPGPGDFYATGGSSSWAAQSGDVLAGATVFEAFGAAWIEIRYVVAV